MEFFQTREGHQFLFGTMPQLVKEIGRLADAIEKANKIAEETARITKEKENLDA